MNDTLLTYEQWCARFKKHTKRYIKKKVMQILQYLFAAVLLTLPFWMFLDWLLRDY